VRQLDRGNRAVVCDGRERGRLELRERVRTAPGQRKLEPEVRGGLGIVELAQQLSGDVVSVQGMEDVRIDVG